jgi:acyl-CoA reductase-like NAD-dependent aldehyde dehydrogenase
MLRETYPFYLANRPEAPNHDLEVLDKYTGAVATRVALAGSADIDRAIAAAAAAVEPMQRRRSYQRREVLEHCVRRFRERSEELALALCIEAGKPIRDARGEVARLIETFRIAAGEAERIVGEVMPLDNAKHTADYVGFWKRVPIGACSFISPFNFPLNLAAHKVAPALACGCPFVLKPASLTPIGALVIAEVLAETDLPPGAFSVLPCHRDGADLFVVDERLKLLSFTGSPQVGWALKARAGKKKLVLELGGNAACIVDADADLDDAITRLIFGAFYQAGQSCISVQRVLVHASIYDNFRERFVTGVRSLVAGDPKDERTFIGPMITAKEAKRLKGWIDAAIAQGARLLTGGGLEKTLLEATVLENVPRASEVYADEAFGPVVLLEPFEDFDAALDLVNASRFGLQAGIFTRDLYKAHRAWDRLDVGGVIIGDVPSWRVDHMPYGGIKDSGLGREGIRFAIEDMTEIRLLAVRTPPSL